MVNEATVVRDATEADVERVLDLWELLNEVQLPIRVFAPVADQRGAARADVLATLHDENARTYVVERDGRMIATAAVEVWHKEGMNDDIVATISRLVVLPEHRARGIASMLIERAESFARARGARHLTAWIYSGNEEAGRFWRARGFRPRVEELTRPILADEVQR